MVKLKKTGYLVATPFGYDVVVYVAHPDFAERKMRHYKRVSAASVRRFMPLGDPTRCAYVEQVVSLQRALAIMSAT